MTFFRQLGDSGQWIAWLFTLISVGYFVSGLRLARFWWSHKREFAEGTLQPWKKHWVERAAFFLAIPPGVFVHELFHALAAWAFGGQVRDVGYAFYWGYVAHIGNYTAGQQWFISLAGTLGTLLFAFALWLALRRSESTSWHYFGLRALRIHLYYALLYYPLFTAFTFIGDWRTIYDYEATPVLSNVTLLVHFLALVLLWYSNREGWYEMPTFQSDEEEAEIVALREKATQNPGDERLQLQVVDALRRRGAIVEAKAQLRQFLKQNPRSGEGHLMMGLLENENNARVSRKSRQYVTKALELGLQNGANITAAHIVLAEYHLNVERWDKALRTLEEAFSAMDKTVPPSTRAHLHYLRALAERRRGQYHVAAQEIAQAIQLAEEAGHEQIVQRDQREQARIARHSS